MTLYAYFNRNIPEYYPTMYLDGFTPEQIRYAVRQKMLRQYEESQMVDEIKITSEVKLN